MTASFTPTDKNTCSASAMVPCFEYMPKMTLPTKAVTSSPVLTVSQCKAAPILESSNLLQITRAAAYENLSGRSLRSFISLNTSRPISGRELAARPEIRALCDTRLGSESDLKTSYPAS